MNIMVFDTETIGKQSQDLLNVGYKIIDINPRTATYKTLCEKNYLVGELYNNTIYMLNDDFVGAAKYEKYKQLLANKQIIKHNIVKIMELTKKDIEKYKVMFGYAYNCNFDIDKFEKTATKLNIPNPLENLPIFDIWAYAQNYIINTPQYIQWAKENAMFTDSGIYLKSSVESVVAFMQQDKNFVEEHTALSDVQHETDILVECLKFGCDITKPMAKGKYIASGQKFMAVATINGEKVSFEYTRTRALNGIVHYYE